MSLVATELIILRCKPGDTATEVIIPFTSWSEYNFSPSDVVAVEFRRSDESVDEAIRRLRSSVWKET